MPQLSDQRMRELIDAGATDDEILQLSHEGASAPADEGGSIMPWLLAGGGALAAGAGALALHNPALLKTAGQGFMDLRRMSMLSGLAPLKSLLGNIGGSAYSSIERGSLNPLKEMLSPTTAREAVAAFKQGPNYAAAGPATGITKFNIPGRIMGALDEASQGALQRAGLTKAEAAREMLQTPLGKSPLTESLANNPVADYLVPFRRTPFNQLSEGLGSFKPENLATTGQRAALATALGTGAVTGATVEDPKTIALGTAASGRRGLPFALAAGATRALTTGSKRKGADVIQGMSPVSDYSLSEGVLGPVVDPTQLIPKPAALKAYDYLKSLLGLEQ